MNQKQLSDNTDLNREDLTDRSTAPDFPAADREMTTKAADGSKENMHGRTGHSTRQTEDLTDRSGAPDFPAGEREAGSEPADRAQASARERSSGAPHAKEAEDWSDRSTAPETPARAERE